MPVVGLSVAISSSLLESAEAPTAPLKRTASSLFFSLHSSLGKRGPLSQEARVCTSPPGSRHLSAPVYSHRVRERFAVRTSPLLRPMSCNRPHSHRRLHTHLYCLVDLSVQHGRPTLCLRSPPSIPFAHTPPATDTRSGITSVVVAVGVGVDEGGPGCRLMSLG